MLPDDPPFIGGDCDGGVAGGAVLTVKQGGAGEGAIGQYPPPLNALGKETTVVVPDDQERCGRFMAGDIWG